MRSVQTRFGLKTCGFTLIELLVIITILGILAAIAVPQFAKYKAKRASIGEIERKIESSYVGTGPLGTKKQGKEAMDLLRQYDGIIDVFVTEHGDPDYLELSSIKEFTMYYLARNTQYIFSKDQVQIHYSLKSTGEIPERVKNTLEENNEHKTS